MKYSITHFLVIVIGAAALSSATGCKLNGPFYSPSAWHFYNPFKKGDPDSDHQAFANTAFEEIPSESSSKPSEKIANLDAPKVAEPIGGYSGDYYNKSRAASKPVDTIADAKDKKGIKQQETLYTNYQPPQFNERTGTALSPPAAPPTAAQTQNYIAQGGPSEAAAQPWMANTAAPMYNTQPMDQPSGYASTTPQQTAGNNTAYGMYTQPGVNQHTAMTVLPPNSGYTQPGGTQGPVGYAQPVEMISSASNAPVSYPPNTYHAAGVAAQPGFAAPNTAQAVPYGTQTMIPPINVPANSVPANGVPANNVPANNSDNPGYAVSGSNASSFGNAAAAQPEPYPAYQPPAVPANSFATPPSSYNSPGGFTNFSPSANDYYRPGAAN
ncbi:MAG: hypothetical protein LBQ54_09700 [Planctomycetaceae bacterium]|jgi:predicted small lipoprotein YifL|nr:hypothetical protein [Planctomycetaceae bacterium]